MEKKINITVRKLEDEFNTVKLLTDFRKKLLDFDAP